MSIMVKQMNDLDILFLYSGSKFEQDAYSLRLDKFKNYFKENNCITQSMYLKDSLFKVPSLLQPINIPFLFKSLNKCDVIHAGNTSCAYFMKLFDTFSDTLFIYDVHGLLIQEYLLNFNKYSLLDEYNLFQSKVLEYFASKSNYFITCSEPLKNYYIKKGVSKKNVEVFRNGVDLDLFRPLDTRDKKENFTVTYAGGFQKWQGIDNLIKAAKIIDDHNVIFKIIGFTSSNYKMKEYLRQEIKTPLILIDSLPREELVKHLNESDVLIIPRSDHPAINVALPTKFAEYIAIGKPVIVTEVDETSTFVKKYECGFVCKPIPESIADAILKAKNTTMEELKFKGQNARRLAKKEFDQNIINKKYYDFVQNIVLKR
jgi:glycosyltransferase involved in cell wall biosynthesis